MTDHVDLTATVPMRIHQVQGFLSLVVLDKDKVFSMWCEEVHGIFRIYKPDSGDVQLRIRDSVDFPFMHLSYCFQAGTKAPGNLHR
jgi:hypothetical protein